MNESLETENKKIIFKLNQQKIPLDESELFDFLRDFRDNIIENFNLNNEITLNSDKFDVLFCNLLQKIGSIEKQIFDINEKVSGESD